MYRLSPFIAPLLLVATLAASAQEAGMVEGLQSPAWMERQGAIVPVAPGMVLRPADRLRTGNGGRLLLRLAEGSHVKLGENARFHLERFAPPAEPDGPFAGLLEVAKGAFRFTTTLLSRPHRRHLDIRVAAVTAGIRGTDVWGKAKPDEDIVCLIEGDITVGRESEPPVTMNEPLSFYVAPKDAPPKPVTKVSEEQLALWAEETELTSGQGIQLAGGRWSVALASFRDGERATRALRGLHEQGQPARIERVEVDGRRWYRLVVSNFKDRGEAKAYASRPELAARHPGAWPYRR
ncbi:MAG: SPOR domain-containing protein [Gammaproteobacteria bacterium]|nr:SPOR domain-containing protein [Gammaproteobacteria bacterium]